MQHPMEDGRRRPRQKVLLDVRQQLPVVLGLVGVCAGCAALLAGAGMVFSGVSLRDMTSTAAGRLALVLDLSYFLTVAAAVSYVGLRITHRVVGPVRVLTEAVQRLRDGDHSGRLSLRHKDFLKELAQSIGELSEDLREADARRRVFHRELQRCLERGDVEAARTLSQRQAERDACQDTVTQDADAAEAAAPVEPREESR